MGLRLSEKPFPNDDALRSALQTVSLDKQLEDSASSLSGGENKDLPLHVSYLWIRLSIY